MKIVLPMAGRGSRFSNKGIATPKPFIPVKGKPMFLHALESVSGIAYSALIVIVLKEHAAVFNIKQLLSDAGYKNISIIELEEVTEGQLATVLTASSYLDTPEDLLILSSDTVIESAIKAEILEKRNACAGIISVAKLAGTQWSFAKANALGIVEKVAEKERISDLASTGIYYFSKGNAFLKYASKIITQKEKTRNEYYVIPVFQKFIDNNETIVISLAKKMWDMGTPESLEQYILAH